MFARPVHYLNQSIKYLRAFSIQQVVNVLIVLIGLTADLIALITYFGAVHTPPTGSNFYVNSREFLAWVLVALVYSIGLINAWIRRRWRKLYGNKLGDHSVFNIFRIFDLERVYKSSPIRVRNFQRDFSFIYVALFPITFFFNRAVRATENATNITPSPWGDLASSAFTNIFVALGMMVITTMFDFAMSMFLGDQHPEDLQRND